MRCNHVNVDIPKNGRNARPGNITTPSSPTTHVPNSIIPNRSTSPLYSLCTIQGSRGCVITRAGERGAGLFLLSRCAAAMCGIRRLRLTPARRRIHSPTPAFIVQEPRWIIGIPRVHDGRDDGGSRKNEMLDPCRELGILRRRGTHPAAWSTSPLSLTSEGTGWVS